MPKADDIPLRIAKLLDGDAEQTSVVTPNRRLASALKREYDMAQKQLGKRVWATLDILPLPTFLERVYRALSLTDGGAGLPQLIDASHSQLLWEQVIRKSAVSEHLLMVSATAGQALAAWQLAHAWQLLPRLKAFPLHEDGQVFLGWATRYQTLTRERNIIDAAMLPETLANLLTARRTGTPTAREHLLPRRLFTAGFDIVTPQQQHFMQTLTRLGCDMAKLDMAAPLHDASAVRRVFNDEVQELRACAQWAREFVEAGYGGRVGIVVPDLREKRSQVERVFTDALQPLARVGLNGFATQAEQQARLFNISLGHPLPDYAMVADALGLIEFSFKRAITYAAFSGLLRSPFIAAAEREAVGRANFDAVLRETSHAQVTLLGLQKRVKLTTSTRLMHARADAKVFCERVDAVASMAESVSSKSQLSGARSRSVNPPKNPGPEYWSRHFAEVLAHWGFPGERALDSIDYQVLAKFRESLRGLAALQVVQQRMHADDALQQLRRILANTVFQPESADEGKVPIQILGVLESAGQSFERLWVTGLSEGAWPLAARANPLIPIAVQRSAGVPEASAAASLALDERITAAWLQAAREVVVSHANLQGDGRGGEEPRAASALVADLPFVVEGPIAPVPNYAEALRAASAKAQRTWLESIPDRLVPSLPVGTTVSGGASMIRDQAACPFRAFARHRLGANALAQPTAGHDAAERGTLLHRVLSLVWTALGTQARLASMAQEVLQALINNCVQTAIDEARMRGHGDLTGRFAEIEHERLSKLVADWLDYERGRQPFEVMSCEASVAASIGPLAISLRLDRLDRLSDGTHALIDYKSGNASVTSWLGARPDEPQLPLYHRTSDAHVSALAFARLKRGKTFGFEGVAVAEGILPDVLPMEKKRGMVEAGYVSWDVLVQEWERSLDALATQFQNGEAAVDPARGPLTCRQCDLQALCRVAESSGGILINPEDDGVLTDASSADGAIDA